MWGSSSGLGRRCHWPWNVMCSYVQLERVKNGMIDVLTNVSTTYSGGCVGSGRCVCVWGGGAVVGREVLPAMGM